MTIELLKEGQVFAERYEVVRCLASGGMGAVYEVIHTETRRRCAMKIMLPNIVLDDAMRDRFKREARVTANIKSDFIVDVLDAGIDTQTDLPFLVMEYLIGEDLSHVVARRGRVEPADVITYLHQASVALTKTHAAGIVHRDLKPENLFLTKTDEGTPRIKILDFGISKVLVDVDTNANRTQSIGTPMYMSPEQMRGRVVPATDVYALAMVAYTLLVGKAYFEDDAEDDNMYAMVSRVVMGPQTLAVEQGARQGAVLPLAFNTWFAKATAAAPEDRYGSATEMVAALAEALGVAAPRAASGPVTASHAPAAAAPREGGTKSSDVAIVRTVGAPPTSSTSFESERRPNTTIKLAVVGAALALVAAGAVAFALRSRPSTDTGIVVSIGADSSSAAGAGLTPPVVPANTPEVAIAVSASASTAPSVEATVAVPAGGKTRPAGSGKAKPGETAATPPTATAAAPTATTAAPPATTPPAAGTKDPEFTRF